MPYGGLVTAHTDNRTRKMSDINADGRRLEWRISCNICPCLNLSFYLGLRDFNTVYASTTAFCLTWRSPENSPAVSRLSFFLRTLPTYCFAVLLYFSLSSLCPWNSNSCELLSVFSKLPGFFVRSNAVSKCVHVDVYPTAGQCHTSKYATVTVHVMQQHSAHCLEVICVTC